MWHATWMINSYAHRAQLVGSDKPRPLRDSALMSFILGGEGNHDWHHKMPSSVKHCHRRWSLDYGYFVLRILRQVGLVKYRNPIHVAHGLRNDLSAVQTLAMRRPRSATESNFEDEAPLERVKLPI